MIWTSRFRVRLAAQHLCRGGVLAYPTEAVYGLGCDPFNRDAVEWISMCKNRAGAKSFILIAASYAQIEPLLNPISTEQKKTLQAKWPGPVTWVVPASDRVPAWLMSKSRTIAVRVTAHPSAAALCCEFGGPIVSTSANPAGMRPARSAQMVRNYFSNDPIKILAGPVDKGANPSAIFDLITGNRLR